MIIRMWIVTRLQGFLVLLMIWARTTKSSWRFFAQSSLGGDDEDMSAILVMMGRKMTNILQDPVFFCVKRLLMLVMMVLMMLVMMMRRVTLKFQIQVLHSVLAPWSWWLGLVWDGVSWIFIN